MHGKKLTETVALFLFFPFALTFSLPLSSPAPVIFCRKLVVERCSAFHFCLSRLYVKSSPGVAFFSSDVAAAKSAAASTPSSASLADNTSTLLSSCIGHSRVFKSGDCERERGVKKVPFLTSKHLKTNFYLSKTH